MANAKSNYLETKVVDHVLSKGVRAFTSPAALYVSLHTADPTEAMGTGELSGNGYARQAVTFDAAAAGVAVNSGQLVFTCSGGNWGTITHFGIYDAATAGNGLYYGALQTSQNITDGNTVTIAAGALSISEL
jgi:hypothetical protein